MPWVDLFPPIFIPDPDETEVKIVHINGKPYAVKTFVYRRPKLPFTVDKIAAKLIEALEPPFRNPLSVKVSKPQKIEDGLISEDVKVTVTLPVEGALSLDKIKREFDDVKMKIKNAFRKL